METSKFDRIATGLAQSRDRRSTVRLLAVALFGLGGVAVADESAGVASATSRKKNHHGRHGHHGRGGSDPGPGTCGAGADACLGAGQPICTCHNGRATGLCRTQLEGGTVCAIDITSPAATACDQCATNDDCRRLGFPPGSSCVVDFGPNCQACQNNAMGACVAPCGFVEPK